MREMFQKASSFNQPINSWVVSKVTDIGVMFSESPFNQSLYNWNLSELKIADHVFYLATQFNQDISNWNMSSVTTIMAMFSSASSFDQDISIWDTSSVTDYGDYGVNSGHSVTLFKNSDRYYFIPQRTPLTNENIKTAVTEWIDDNNVTKYGGHISNWHVSNVTDMSGLFEGKSDFDEDLGNWDVSNVTTMWKMFKYATLFNNGGSDNIKNWNLASLETAQGIFIDTSFNQDISAWTFPNEIHLGGLFYGTPFNQDISGWNVSNATAMSYMFADSPFNQDISGWDVSKVTSIGHMFKDNDDFDQDISGWDVSKVTSFGYASQGTNHSDSLFNSSSQYYFTIKQALLNDTNIQTAVNEWIEDGSNKYKYGHNIATWNTSAVTNMDSLFKDKTSFNDNISGWDVSKVTSMDYMFENASSFNRHFIVNVTGITHPSTGSNGQFFYFDLNEWNLAFGDVAIRRL